MVFSAPFFLFVFLPITLGIYFLIPAKLLKARNVFLLVASLVFYAWGSGGLVGLLIVSTLVDYTAGLVIAKGKDTNRPTLARAGLVTSILINVGMLAYFKYANWFVAEVNRFGDAIGIEPLAWQSIALPIGISFFTFQSMSYSIDVYTGRAERLKNILDFGLYVALFPQLVAGPIVRFHEIAASLLVRSSTWDRFNRGMQRFAWGLGKKVLIGDPAGAVADAVFALPSGEATTLTAWVGIVAYTIQIYFDFSGYSDMAIGIGLILGFQFPENFKRPYSSVSMTDFWRRWHITLSNWFRDYVFIPLGGSRGSTAQTIRNLWIVFLITGLWHGAAWTFILWGIYHGTLLSIERLTGQRHFDDAPSAQTTVRRGIVLVLVMVGWVLFRSPSVSYAVDYLMAMANLSAGQLSVDIAATSWIGIAIGGAIFFASTHPVGPRIGKFENRRTDIAFTTALVLVIFPLTLIRVLAGTFSPFIYFQF